MLPSLAFLFPLFPLLLDATAATPPGAAVPLPARDAPAARAHIQAVRIKEPVVLDGRLDDPAWSKAIPSDQFTQHQPNEGAPPSERTELRVLYDDDAIYIGIDCTQRLSPVVRRLMRRDRELPSDGVWLDIDSRRDGVSAFHFGVNAAGSMIDAIHFNDVGYSSSWDETWEARVADTDHGYSAEFRIPLRVLRFDALPLQDFGLQVRRFIDARQEYDDWAFYPRNAAGYVRHFGRLEGLSHLRHGRPVELRPFALGRLRARTQDLSAGTLAQGTDWRFTGGVDGKAHVTPELTLDLAVFPDFGQVEADTVVLNLSTYETFFPEKRPFFLEGSDIWNASATLVYTRRIGRQPAAPTLLPTGEILVDLPEPSPIYGAAKLSGTIGGRTTVGLLSAITGRNQVQIEAVGGARERRLTDPMTVFHAVRIKHQVARGTELGLLATATNRFESVLPAQALCPGSATAEAVNGRCQNDAYVAAADGRWRSASGDYAAAGQASLSLLRQGPARAQRDGIAVQPGRAGAGGTLWIGKQGGRRWLWDLTQTLTGRQLELNDLGYLDRKNDYTLTADVAYRRTEAWWHTLETRAALIGSYRRTLDGIDLDRFVQLETAWTLRGYWGFYADVHCKARYFDDRETGDGTALQRAGLCGSTLSISTDPRRRVVASVSGQIQRIGSQGARYETRGQITLRLLPQLELDVLPTFIQASGEPRYISQAGSGDDTIYTFGRLLARSLGATVRASYAFTPHLSLQAYGQLFLASLHYSDFSSAPRTGFRQRVYLDQLAGAGLPASNPDSERATLNLNVVLRWEYRLGSTLFLVYTRAQSPATTVDAGRAATLDLGRLSRAEGSADVIMCKLSYWWG